MHPDKYNLKLIYMKSKHRLKNLEEAKKWWDKQPESYKRSTTRPGSVKQRIITGLK